MNLSLSKAITFFYLSCILSLPISAQSSPTPVISSFNEMKAGYTGTVCFDSASKTVTFTSSGVLNFPDRAEETSHIWHIPNSIDKVVLEANVQVTGQFTWGHPMIFEGKDQMTSILYGTPKIGLLNSLGLDKKYTCTAYSAFYGYGSGDSHIKNLTCLNPVGFMFTGKNGCRLHLDKVRGIDDRGGYHNHSDGISAANGSTVRNCYLETGDDAIKVYADILVENTEIVMIQNCVPIQYGWGTYGNGATGIFKNVKISGTSGRNNEKFVINMASENAGEGYKKSIIMDSCTIMNPNATLFLIKDKRVASDVSITNSRIAVKDFGINFGTGTFSICGSNEKKNTYDCLNQER